MPQPNYGQLHINAPLTNVSVAFQQDANRYIADQVFPQVPVDKQGDLYFQYLLEDWIRGQADVRAPGTESTGGGYDLTTGSYFANVFAVHKDIDDQTMQNADAAFNLQSDATEWVTDNLLLKRDRDFAAAYLTTGVWTGSTTGTDLTPATLWSSAGSTPIEDIAAQQYAIDSVTGKFPNTLVIGAKVLPALLNHAEILDRIKYTGAGGFTTMQILAQAFQVDRVVVARAVQNTAPKGVTANVNYLVGKSAWLGYSEPNPGLMKASAGYIFTWTGLLGAGAYGTRIKSWYIDEIASTRVEGETAYAMKVIAPQLGAFWSAVVA